MRFVYLPFLAAQPVWLQPIGILPELHYVIHVGPAEFVRRLHNYELESKPAQLRRAINLLAANSTLNLPSKRTIAPNV